jgi:hypothetical protein
MSQSVPIAASHLHVPLPLYRDNWRELAGAVRELAAKDRNAAESMLMRPIEWPRCCVVCSSADPDNEYEIAYAQVSEGPEVRTTTTYRRKGVPICRRCKIVKDAGELHTYWMIGAIIASVIGALVAAIGVFDLSFTHAPPQRSVAQIVIGALIIPLAGAVFLIKDALFRRSHPEAKTLPWSEPVSMNESGFVFRNQDFANRFAEANSSCVTPVS